MDDNKLFNLLKTAGKIVAKQIFKRLIRPYLPVIGLVVILIFLLFMFVGAIYSAIPQTGTVTGDVNTQQTQQDKQIIADDKKMANKYNVANTWLVSDETVKPDEPDVGPPVRGWYDHRVGRDLKSLADHYGTDKTPSVGIYTWGFVNALETFYAATQQKQVNSDDTDKLADYLKPYFYYEKSEIVTTSCDKDG